MSSHQSSGRSLPRGRSHLLARPATFAGALMLGFLLWGGIAHAAGPTATVSLSPSSIPADGISQSTVTVTLSPPLTGQTITLSAPFDPHISFSAVHDNGDGTYTATLTSSRSAETTQIFAFDASGTTAAYPAMLT